MKQNVAWQAFTQRPVSGLVAQPLACDLRNLLILVVDLKNAVRRYRAGGNV